MVTVAWCHLVVKYLGLEMKGLEPARVQLVYHMSKLNDGQLKTCREIKCFNAVI